MLSNAEHINESTPPAFLVHARADDVVSFLNSQKYHEACKQLGVPSRYILLSAGEHGPGIRDGKPIIKGSEEDYADAMVEWIKEIVQD
jgi:dipeptidyl aminopeptidase/acylaminoacyl peptidase